MDDINGILSQISSKLGQFKVKNYEDGVNKNIRVCIDANLLLTTLKGKVR